MSISNKERVMKCRKKLEVRKSIEKYKGIKDIDYVECEICKKRSKRIDIRHIRNRHNLTKEEYLEKFPESLLYCKKYSEIQARPNNKVNLGRIFSKEHRKKISLSRTNGIILSDDDIDKFKKYRSKVRLYSERSYRKYYSLINPYNLKRGKYDYHLDHIYPVIEGFRNNISEKTIAHYSNLRVIHAKENLEKGDKLI